MNEWKLNEWMHENQKKVSKIRLYEKWMNEWMKENQMNAWKPNVFMKTYMHENHMN